MKIVQKIYALVIATSISLSLVSCGVNNEEYKDGNEQEIVSGEIDNKEETKLIDEVEIYKTINERGIKFATVEDCAKIYLELDVQRQKYDEEMKHSYENYQLYTSNVITQNVLNTVKIYYDMMSVLSRIYKNIKTMPEETEEEINVKLSKLSEVDVMYKKLEQNQHDSMWIWFGNNIHINKEQKKDILLFADLFELAEMGIGGNHGTTYIERDINKLTNKLEDIKNSGLNI